VPDVNPDRGLGLDLGLGINSVGGDKGVLAGGLWSTAQLGVRLPISRRNDLRFGVGAGTDLSGAASMGSPVQQASHESQRTYVDRSAARRFDLQVGALHHITDAWRLSAGLSGTLMSQSTKVGREVTVSDSFGGTHTGRYETASSSASGGMVNATAGLSRDIIGLGQFTLAADAGVQLPLVTWGDVEAGNNKFGGYAGLSVHY
jgi:hypothetical protein